MFNKFIYLSILLLLFCGCKKEHRYPEDPDGTITTPKNRLKGTWKIREYTLNGSSIVSSLNAIPNQTADILNDVTFLYGHDEYEKKYWYLEILGPFSTYHDLSNSFNDFHFLKIGPRGDSLLYQWFITPFKFVTGTTASWTVTKLYEKDLNLVLKTDTGEFKMFLFKTDP